ncbi:hypothetical protein [Flavobacterium terrae]|uniref:Uncharacterized protein n=1 Tax=Flavobacterium terrae TaxID=415425 RepID=A0A1M6EH44_9FLAO|nr:hypothetical protein [Flavobacterium terrae]SHI84794.1 hypothetical protein SAMN05444363_1771 [Flavobacterium terrae]
MNTTKDSILSNVAKLSSYASTLSLASAKQVLDLRDELLALPEENEVTLGGRSGLNIDGSPLQYCISSSSDGLHSRFISDPSCIAGSPEERFKYSYQALQKLYITTQTEEIKSVCEEMLDFHLPESKENMEDYPDGVFWLGASPDSKGMAIYIDGRRGGKEESWERFRTWLNHLMPNNTEVDNFVKTLSPYANIMSIGLEGSSLKNLRAKIYFRLTHKLTIEDLKVPILLNESVSNFMNDVIGNKDVNLAGIVFNVGFHIASSKLFDAKIDVCACPSYVELNPSEWVSLLDQTASKNNVVKFPITEETLENDCAVSYYGLGIDIMGNKRLNLYLKNKTISN